MPLRQVNNLETAGDIILGVTFPIAGAVVWSDFVQVVDTVWSIGLAIGGAVLLYYRIRHNIYQWRNRQRRKDKD